MNAVAEPRLLILETSGRVGQVALAQGELLLGSRRLDEARRHARDLAPAVAELLTEQRWRPRDLHGIVVSQGPGSYTGLRVGIMSAKTLAFATGSVLLAVDTFAAIALQAPAEFSQLAVLADAQQDRVYLQRFARPDPAGFPVPVTALTIESFSDRLARLDRSEWLTGPGLRGHENQLPGGTPIVDSTRWDPAPNSLLRLGLARYRAGAHDDIWALEPRYLRPSSAEEKWAQRKS